MAIDKNIAVTAPAQYNGDIKPDMDSEANNAGVVSPQSENNENLHESDRHKGLPIDRGWAWVVLAGAILYLTLFGGIRKNLGIFFVAFQDRFQSSASLTSTLTTMQNIILSVTSLFVMTIGMQYISNRTAIMCGALCLTTANIITAFATDISLLFLSVGFLEGFGTALIHPPVTAALGEYFHERRGFANGIAFSGASFGGLIFAPIMSALLQNYGYTGTFMIVAGMTFHFLISGALLRPIKSFEKNKSKEDSTLEENGNLLCKETLSQSSINADKGSNRERNESEEILRQLALEAGNRPPIYVPNKAILQLKMDEPPSLKIVRSDSYTPDNKTTAAEKSVSPLLPRARAWSESNHRKRTISGVSSQTSNVELSPLNSLIESLSRSRVALYASADGICGSVIDIKEIKTEEKYVVVDDKPTWLKKLKDSFDVSLFRNPVFPVFLFMAAMFAPTCALLPGFLAPYARDQGISREEVGILMSTVGGVGMLSRIACALFADRKLIKLTTLLASVSMCIGIVAHCIRFFNTFRSLVFVAVMLGLCCELYQAMFAVILVEYLTLPKLKSSIGFTVLCHGIAIAGTFPVIGTLRDSTGSYYASYHFLGAQTMVGAILALSIPYVHGRQNKKMEDVADL